MRRALFLALALMPAFGVVVAASRSAIADGRAHHEVVEAPAIPRWLTLPVEYGDAVTWVPDRPGPVYRVSGSVLPGVVFDHFSLHLPIEALYRNPGANYGVGLRGTAFCTPFGGILALGALAQGTYLLHHRAFDLSAGGLIGVGTLAHVAVLYGYDTDRQVRSIAIRIGYNVLSMGDPVAAITHFVPQAPAPGLAE